MTPTRKGRYTDCNTCVFKTNEDIKYPCVISHKEIRKNSGSTLEREFKECGIHKKGRS